MGGYSHVSMMLGASDVSKVFSITLFSILLDVITTLGLERARKVATNTNIV